MLWNHINGPSGTRTAIFSKSPWSQMSFCEFTMRCIHVPRPTWEWISERGERERDERYRETQREWQNQIKSMQPHNTSSAHLYLSYFKVGDLVSIMSALFGATWEKYQRMHFITNRQKVGSAWWRYKVIWLLYVVEVHLYWHAVLKHSCNFLLVFIY